MPSESDVEPTTRDRILQAAIQRFSAGSYEDIGLRLIADDVRVDVSYVHRCFGSKKALFTEALAHTLRSLEFPDSGDTSFGAYLASLVAGARLPTREEGRPLDIIVASLSSREAKPVLREALVNSFLAPMTARFPDVPRKDIVLAFSMLLGIGIFTRVLDLEAMPGLQESEKRALLAEDLRAMFER